MEHDLNSLASTLQPGTGWPERLREEFDKEYMQKLGRFLAAEERARKVIFPPSHLCFNALNSTPFSQVAVVILGQDPYHGRGQAHGLSFSVRPGVRVPPSLRNIFREIRDELGIEPPDHGCLQPWAEQGVLLLNSVLTVEEGRAGAHQGRGWERFTSRIIGALNDEREGLVFMLWGNYAQKRGEVIDRQRHCVLESAHPSPLSARRGFIGNGHFNKANQWLAKHGLQQIDWALPKQDRLLVDYSPEKIGIAEASGY